MRRRYIIYKSHVFNEFFVNISNSIYKWRAACFVVLEIGIYNSQGTLTYRAALVICTRCSMFGQIPAARHGYPSITLQLSS